MVSVSKVIVLVVVLLGLASALIVSAKAERRLPKTEVDIEFTVTAEDKTPAKALEKANSEAQKLAKAVEKFGSKGGVYVSEADLEAVVDANGKVTGYKSEIEVELDLEDGKNLAKAVEAGSKFGTLSDVEYEVDESAEEDAYVELTKEAFEAAEEKAKAYAEAIGVKLGDIDTIEIDDITEQDEDDEDESSDTSVEVHILYELEDDEDGDDDDDDDEKEEEEEKEESKEEEAEPEPEPPKSVKKPKPAKK